jgi:hypothetical protein
MVCAAASSLLKKVSGTLKVCENPGNYAARKVPDTFFNRLPGLARSGSLLEGGLQIGTPDSLFLARRVRCRRHWAHTTG